MAPPDVLQLGINKTRQDAKKVSHSVVGLSKQIKQHEFRTANPVNSHGNLLLTQIAQHQHQNLRPNGLRPMGHYQGVKISKCCWMR